MPSFSARVRTFADRPHVRPPRRPFPRLTRHQLLLALTLGLYLVFGGLGDWTFLIPHAYAAGRPSDPTANVTFQHFLKHPAHTQVYRGPFVFPSKGPHVPRSPQERPVDLAHLPKSAQPATMQPIREVLNLFLFAPGPSGGSPLELQGSDHHLNVLIQPGSLDFSHATVAKPSGSQSQTNTSGTPTPTATPGTNGSGNPPTPPFTIQLTQLSGHFAEQMNLLGTYQLQVVDSTGQVVSGIQATTPISIVYHYQPWEFTVLGVDPSQVLLTWPGLITSAQAAHQSTTGLVLPMANDPTAQTLSAQSSVLGPGMLTLGANPANQHPPTPQVASEQGNSGQLGFSYPLTLPPNARGFLPQLALTYSSGDPNGRSSWTSPAGDLGDGWSLGLGSITAVTYPNGSAQSGPWYFLSGVGNISDRLVPDTDPGFYQTMHLSHLRIQQVTSNGQPCFQVYDTSGTFFEFGCTTDSLEYWTDSGGTRTNYAWNLDKIISPNEGPTAMREYITVSYEQDSVTTSGHTSIRDAAIKQILYGSRLSDKSQDTRAGTVDFSYKGPFNDGSWVSAYGTNYNCDDPPTNTTLRCDDPLTFGSVAAPTVMSTFSLQSVTTYVGDDSSSTHKDTAYRFTSQDLPFFICYDPYTMAEEYCAGEHLLTSITPTMHQNGTIFVLKPVNLSYSQKTDRYLDTSHNSQNGQQYFGGSTFWQYLTSYQDTDSGIGEHISYLEAAANTDGTPYITDGNGNIIDDRHDPLYCALHANDPNSNNRCNGDYSFPYDHAWSVQVVTQITSWGSDSSALAATTTSYTYRLANYGTYSGSGRYCIPAGSPPYLPGQTDCTFDTWIPGNSGSQDQDWLDYYHGEFRGFQVVYTTTPSNDLVVDNYYSTEGWASPQSNSGNYNAGSLFEADVYSGNSPSGPLLLKTTTQYTGNNGYNNSCDGLSNTYTPCEVMVVSSTTTELEGTGSSSAPWVTITNTYDDYTSSGGLSGGYHNLTQQVVTSSNAPTLTRKFTYTINDQTVNGTVYYTVDKVTYSEVDDSSGHIWACQNTTYDEGAASGVPTPDAGWPTTVKAYSNCASKASSTITSSLGYDAFGNPVANVDGLAFANNSLYSGHGCTLSTAPVYKSASWTLSHYTSCTTIDSYHAQPTTGTNALGQTDSVSYDYTQGSLPVSSTDANNQVTTTAYSYDSSGNRTVNVKAPAESGSYTGQSSTNSQCSSSSTLPCFEVDSHSAQYPTAIARTFSDSLGRAVETRTTGPDAGHDTIVFTAYNDAAHSVFTSVPFEVNSGTSWIDPNGAVDYNGVAPGGSVVYLDALGRPLATDDPLLGSSQEPGISCPALSGHHTACAAYGLGSAHGDSATYLYSESLDSNNHAAVSFSDALGRTRYSQEYSGLGLPSLSSNIVQQKSVQYTVLSEPTSVTTTDLAPESGQSITSVSATASYDDLGRMSSMSDPDKGTHTFSSDADSRILTDVSGTRTLGTNDDLLGRVGCLEDIAPVINATGACTTGSHAYVQDTYDTTQLGTQGLTDFPVGRLTKSVATTYYPDSTTATVTDLLQHDQRGRTTLAQLQLGTPSSWGITTALPTYQASLSYNDADQATTTTTSTVPAGQGYTTTNVYDNTSGALIGLSNTGSANASVASLTFTPRALINTITFQTTTPGSALATQQYGYDANLRPTSATATWLSGSGSSGTILSQSRTYDPSSNVTSLATTLAAVPSAQGSGGSETQNFCYDEQARLVWGGNSGTQPGAGNGTCGSGTLANSLTGANYSTNYVYTHLGQLWQAPLSGSSTQEQYLYCDSTHPHQLTGLYQTGSTCSNKLGQTYGSLYDAWGNVTSRSLNSTTATLSYDGLNDLTKWDGGSSGQEHYSYDASGSRVLRRSSSAGSTTMTVYAFGTEEHQYSGTGANQANTYYYSLGGKLVGESNGSSANVFLTDALGSVLETISAVANSAAVQGNQVYGPYGTSRYQQGSMGTAKGFTGQYNDGLTGLDYYGSRYYDPAVGRFLSADRGSANLAGMDPYAYVGGNPETFTDPTGQFYAPPRPSGDKLSQQGGGPGPGSSSPGTQGACYSPGAVSGTDCTPMEALVETATVVDLEGSGHCGVNAKGDIGISINTGALVSAAVNYNGSHSLAPGVSPTGTPGGQSQPLLPPGFQLYFGNIASGSGGCGGSGGQAVVQTASPAPFCVNPLACAAAEESGGSKGQEESANPGFGSDTCGALSFTPTTSVTTDHGKQAIGTLSVGERVLAYNPSTHKMELEPILHVWINHDNDLVDLTLTTTTPGHHGKAATQTSEVIHTNQKHPFLTLEQGFLPVGKLTLGMHIVRADGRVGVVTGWKVVAGTKVMYNLEVAQDHTYTVGIGQWVVHNTCKFGFLADQLAKALNKAAFRDSYGTVAVAFALEEDLNVATLVGMNSSTLRPWRVGALEALLEGWGIVVPRAGDELHAEENILAYMQAHNMELLGIGASRDICFARCAPAILSYSGGNFDVIGTPIKDYISGIILWTPP